jgi:NADPH:quinone reductase
MPPARSRLRNDVGAVLYAPGHFDHGETMKAIRIHEYGGPNVLVYEDVDTPQPGPGQILVRLRAIGVNPVDAAVRAHRFPTPKQPPRIIGSDGAGVVTAIGSEVTAVAAGDEVMFTGLGIGSEGSYAAYAVIAEAQAVIKPASLSFEEAAAMSLVFPTAHYALVRRAQTLPGETVLVQGGAGGIGSAAVQIARALGARVLATVSSAEDARAVEELGAEHAMVRTAVDVGAEAKRLTDGRGVDVIVEPAAADNMAIDMAALAKGGRIVIVGLGSAGELTVPAGAGGLDAGLLFMSSSNAGRAGTAQILAELAAMAAAGTVRAVIGTVLPLAEAQRAHELLEQHHFGKIVLVP